MQDGVDISKIFAPAQFFKTFGDLVTVIVRNAFVLAGIISFVLLVFGSFTVIMGAGNPKSAEKGKQAITGAVAGLVIIVTSYWIVQIIERITGLPLLNPQ